MDPSQSTSHSPCPPLPRANINSIQLSQEKHVNYSQEKHVNYRGLHFDRSFTCCKHIFAKWTQPGNTLTKIPKCIGYLDPRQNSPQATDFSYIKQYSNKRELTEYNSGAQPPLPSEKS
jgi:hypothetical protein